MATASAADLVDALAPMINRLHEIADQRDELRTQIKAVMALCQNWDEEFPGAAKALASSVLAILKDADLFGKAS